MQLHSHLQACCGLSNNAREYTRALTRSNIIKTTRAVASCIAAPTNAHQDNLHSDVVRADDFSGWQAAQRWTWQQHVPSCSATSSGNTDIIRILNSCVAASADGASAAGSTSSLLQDNMPAADCESVTSTVHNLQTTGKDTVIQAVAKAPQKLTSRLASCKSVKELYCFCRRYSSSFNVINASAMLHRLAVLLPRNVPTCEDRQQVVSSRLSLAVSNIYSSPVSSVPSAANCSASSQRLSSLLPKDIHRGRGVQHLLQLSLQLLRANLAELDNQGLASAIYALGRIRHLDAELLMQLLRISEPRLLSFTPQQLANTAWGLARIGYHPPSTWLSAFLHATQKRLQQCSMQVLANCLWAMAKLQTRPPGSWVGSILQQIKVMLADANSDEYSQELSMVLYSLGRLQYIAGAQWMLTALVHIQAQLHAVSKQELTTTLWALARLDYRPLPTWQAAYFVALEEALPRLSEGELVIVLYSAARMQLQPDNLLLVAAWKRAVEAAEQWQPANLARALWAAAALPALQRDYHGVQVLLGAVHAQLAKANTQDLAMVWYSVAKMRYKPGGVLLKDYLSAVTSRLQRFNPQQLANIAWAAAQLKLQPGWDWCGALATTAAERLPFFSDRELRVTYGSFVWLIQTNPCGFETDNTRSTHAVPLQVGSRQGQSARRKQLPQGHHAVKLLLVAIANEQRRRRQQHCRLVASEGFSAGGKWLATV